MLLDNRRLLPLLALLQLLLIPALWPQLQLWVVAVSLLTLGVRAMMLWRGWRAPPARALALLAITGALLLAWRLDEAEDCIHKLGRFLPQADATGALDVIVDGNQPG